MAYREGLESSFSGLIGGLENSVNVVAELFSGGSNQSDEVQAVYRVIIALIISMSTIWLLRAIASSQKFKLRDAYLFGPAQIVPFGLVALTILIQVLPFYLLAWVSGLLRDNGVLESGYEQTVAVVLVLLVGLLGLYLSIGSFFALIIATISGTRPYSALKTSLLIAAHRRWLFVRKFIGAVVAVAITMALLLVTVASIHTGVLEYAYLLIVVGAVVFMHVFMYQMYLEAIKE
ncbi:MAG: hypothetical protein AAF413_04515 [Patescibacteria group bacterium]